MNVTPDLLDRVTSGMSQSNNEPSTADIAQLCDIANVEREQALVLLRKWPNWQDAITHYFEDPVGSLQSEKLAWQPQENAPPLPPYPDLMSRPPSRTGQFVDLTHDHTVATAQANNNAADADDDLRRAMAASVQDIQGQETGTTHTSGQLRPANASHYNDNEWAMTTIATRELVDHPPPSQRRRDPDEPAFLRGAPCTGYEASLLTIYHSIPLAREALMCPALRIYSYGYDPDWWAGSTNEDSKSISVEQGRDADEDRQRYLAELQCLMAFLDDTTRAYGSVDALSEMKYLQHHHADSATTRLLEAWKDAFMREIDDDPLSQVFSTTAQQTSDFNGLDPMEKVLFAVDGPCDGATTQAELLDKIVWADTTTRSLNNVWLDHLGHIITMRVYNDEYAATQLKLRPTELWYLDRYTHDFRDTLFDMRRRCYQLLHERESLSRQQRHLTELASDKTSNGAGSIRQALEGAKAAITLVKGEDGAQGANIEGDTTTSVNTTTSSGLQKHIDLVLATMEAQLDRLEKQKDELNGQIREIMRDISDPETSSRPLQLKYTLHGASTKQNITYFRRPNRDLLGLDGVESAVEPWQWWRAAWGEDRTTTAESTANPVAKKFSIKKTSFSEVTEAVATEHHSAVLVYANETALTYRPDPLPNSLRQFVMQDNNTFDDELSIHNIARTARKRTWSNETNSTVMNDSDGFADEIMSNGSGVRESLTVNSPKSGRGSASPSENFTIQNVSNTESPPPYEELESVMTEPKVNKIGQYAEQLLQKIDSRQSQGG